MRRSLAILVIALTLLAGCTGQSDPKGAVDRSEEPGGSRAPPPPAPEPSVSLELGAIAGRVVDDEQRPLAHATALLVETMAESKSDAEGAFTFSDLQPGKYGIVVTRIGYEEAARRIEVVAGEVSHVNLTLVQIVIREPYHYGYDRVALIGVGNVFFQDGTWLANQSALNSVVCEPCQFVNHIPVGASDGMTETLWLAGQSGVPGLNADAWIVLKRNWTTGVYGDGTNVVATYFSDREKVSWSESAVAGLKGVDRLMIQVHGGIGVNVQHKIQIFNTVGYNGPLPDDFSALPPAA